MPEGVSNYDLCVGPAKHSRTIYGKPQNPRHLASSTQRRRVTTDPEVDVMYRCHIAHFSVQHIYSSTTTMRSWTLLRMGS